MPINNLDTLLSGLKQHVALFILNLQEKHLLPKVTQDTIVTNLQFVLKVFHQNYAEIITFHLDNSGFILEDHDDLGVLLYLNMCSQNTNFCSIVNSIFI